MLIKKIQKLKFVAYLGIAGILVFFISFIVYFVGVLLVRESHCSSEMVAFEPADGMTIVSMSSVFFYVFCFQHNQFAIFKGTPPMTQECKNPGIISSGIQLSLL